MSSQLPPNLIIEARESDKFQFPAIPLTHGHHELKLRLPAEPNPSSSKNPVESNHHIVAGQLGSQQPASPLPTTKFVNSCIPNVAVSHVSPWDGRQLHHTQLFRPPQSLKRPGPKTPPPPKRPGFVMAWPWSPPDWERQWLLASILLPERLVYVIQVPSPDDNTATRSPKL